MALDRPIGYRADGRQVSDCREGESLAKPLTGICQNSGLEPHRSMLEGEKPTRSESRGGRGEDKIAVLATPEPRDLTEPGHSGPTSEATHRCKVKW